MNIKYEPIEEPASTIKPGEICLLDGVPHKRLEDGGPIPDRRGLLPFLVGNTIAWIHADTKIRPRRMIDVIKVPIGVGFLLTSGAEYVRVEADSSVDPDSGIVAAAATWVLGMQVGTGRIFTFKQSLQVICVDIVAIVKA